MMSRRILSRIALPLLALAIGFPSNAHAASASCYGPGLFGNPMASGAILTPQSIALAHRTLPLGTRLMVIRTEGPIPRRARMMVIRDRGPYHPHRTLDVSQAGVQRLGVASCRSWGVRNVRTWRYPYRG